MKMTENPYEGSPYDASGMPLGASTVDYDRQDDVAKHTVKDKPVEHPFSINDIDYQPKQMSKKFTGEDPRYIPKKGFNSAIVDDVNSQFPLDAPVADFDDPEVKEAMVSKDQFVSDKDEPADPDFLAALDEEAK